MPISTQEHENFRRLEGVELKKAMVGVKLPEKCPSVEVLKNKADIFSEPRDPNQAMKLTCINDAMRTVTARGIKLPNIQFYLSENVSVPNVAYMSDLKGGEGATVLLGGKYWTMEQIKDSKTGGVPNQMFDGSQRWFGNPKQKAFGTALVIHEIGHLLHEINAPEIFWNNKFGKTKEPKPNVWGDASMKVSTYCATKDNCLEFIAETFAGVLCGKTYGAVVKKAYEACGGYPIPKF